MNSPVVIMILTIRIVRFIFIKMNPEGMIQSPLVDLTKNVYYQQQFQPPIMPWPIILPRP